MRENVTSFAPASLCCEAKFSSKNCFRKYFDLNRFDVVRGTIIADSCVVLLMALVGTLEIFTKVDAVLLMTCVYHLI